MRTLTPEQLNKLIKINGLNRKERLSELVIFFNEVFKEYEDFLDELYK